MAFTRNIEREVKLEADLVFELPELKARYMTVRRAAQRLSTAYFDTPDLRLWQRNITLRHRTGERQGDSTWTLKLPEGASGQTLDRAEYSWPEARETIPSEALQILLGVVRRAPLTEIVDLETTRRRLLLRDADGASAELADDTVTVVGGHRDGLRFRQLELEVEGDATAMIDRVVNQLHGAGARSGGQPKLAIALGLPSEPERQGARLKSRDASLGDIVRASITDGLDRLLDRDYRLRLEAENPAIEDVHQARVATRRLRSDLKTFRPLLDPVWLDHTRSELEWLAHTLGEIRDLDVLAGNLGREDKLLADSAETGDELGSILRAERRSDSLVLAEQMQSGRYLDLIDRLHAAGDAPPFYSGATTGSRAHSAPSADDPARRELPPLVRARFQALRKRVRQAGSKPTDRDLHRIRIAAKQLRYASETAEPVVEKPATRMAAAAEQLQTVLGEHHDAVAAEQWLCSIVGTLTPAASFEAGRLAAEQQWRQCERRSEWRIVWRKLNRKKVRRWVS